MEQPDSREIFEARFGHEPEVTRFAPGRINIIGEHVDYNEGLVLPTPLAQGISVSASLGGEDLQAVSTLDGAVTHRELTDTPQDIWTDYLVGALQISGVAKGVRIAVDSNLPAGASVSSSAALLVATLKALNDLLDLSLTDQKIALLAQRVENEYLGLRNGLMDQMVSACGTFGKALLFDTQSGEISDHALIPDTAILTLHSGEDRRLVGNAYNDRRTSCERAAADIGVTSLREASLNQLDMVEDATDRARARHVISEHQRTLDVLSSIEQNNPAEMGKLITACHHSLSSDYDVSTPAMDALVSTALSAGALGARMTGAGFGGCIIVLTTLKKADVLRAEIFSKHPKAYDVATLVF
ncbi:MAG: galactokinase [Pseudomonadota bacterium]